jgi:hypothetical protein
MLRRPHVFAPCLLAVALVVPAARAAAQTPAPPSLKLSFDADGRVTLSAQNVTVRDVMAEWARQCGCFIVNADKLTGPPFATPILFERQPQDVVLGSLLRQAAGYSLTPIRPGSKSVSKYEVIYVLATSSAAASPGYAASSPVAVPLSTPGAVDDEIPPVTPQAPQTPATAQLPPRPATTAPGTTPTPGQTPGYAAPAGGTGTASVFVPLVPVGSSQSQPQQPANQPGRPTTTPGR